MPVDTTLTHSLLVETLRKKIQTVDFTQARQDVSPFIRDPQATDLWSTDFFMATLEHLLVC